MVVVLDAIHERLSSTSRFRFPSVAFQWNRYLWVERTNNRSIGNRCDGCDGDGRGVVRFGFAVISQIARHWTFDDHRGYMIAA
ncbi:hypothetical protein KIN20_028740 [Parelaphostrongylus tenuis]|uniref:Uncharacterized protein n=1 Tax=Parelaphostrongylus tenuis TaxID=148309 RepID=A0AAD5R1A9_PARTN|nr:hypothetical protein KIN20_028740 [Parelaphostrongylus tenuis]